MGALCWVLPQEEDRETLEEREGGVFPGAGLVERLVDLLDQATCCLGHQRPAEGLVLLVNRDRVWVLDRQLNLCLPEIRDQIRVSGCGNKCDPVSCLVLDLFI